MTKTTATPAPEATEGPTMVSLPINPRIGYWVTTLAGQYHVTRTGPTTYNVLNEGAIEHEGDWVTAFETTSPAGRGRVCSTHGGLHFVRPSGQSGCPNCSADRKAATSAKRAAAKAKATAATEAAAAAAAEAATVKTESA